VLLSDLEAQTNVTVVAQLANGMQYQLQDATCKSALEANTRDGQARVRWEGIQCIETGISGADATQQAAGAAGVVA